MYAIGSFMLVIAIAATIASCRSLVVLWSSVSCPRSCPIAALLLALPQLCKCRLWRLLARLPPLVSLAC